ncbi:MAG TPA: hypothetical protein VJH92_00110 [Candidatus Nanoarchaeia archaeon]|nr:hypothetical protein [Candidatus Nanoarchaeia archaeon]
MSIVQNKSYEREFVNLMTKLNIDCHRVAGSGAGKEAVCDCIMFYQKKTYLVEVKATKEKKLYMRGRIKEQLQNMLRVCEKNEVVPLLAIKFKHRGWNLCLLRNFEHIDFIKEAILDETDDSTAGLPIN